MRELEKASGFQKYLSFVTQVFSYIKRDRDTKTFKFKSIFRVLERDR